MNLKHLLLSAFAISGSLYADAISISHSNGWLESCFAEWTNDSQYSNYHVYCRATGGDYVKIDDELVRNYGEYGRADVLGLTAGSYQLKVVPVKEEEEISSAAVETPVLSVSAHDRSGFGFTGNQTPGAYDANGKLKSNAVVVYITDANKESIEMDVTTSSKCATTSCSVIVEILQAYKKGYETRPLDIRIIGKVTNSGAIGSDSNCKGDIVIDLGNAENSPVTIEGVGNDATAYGWGVRIKNAYYCEVRNLGFLYCNSDEGDNVGLQQNNYYIWVHHNDMFYGKAGSDADQVKGDGALDCKKSSYITFSYNHFWDNGKCNLLGLSEGVFSYEEDALFITYHHNWYDHSDSRHPRCRYYNAHVYNNYYDGNSKYGAGATEGSSVFMQNNYFRNCKYPMLTSMQGSDLYGTAFKRTTDNATFSKEDGGFIKACGNVMTGTYTFIPYGATKVFTSGEEEDASVRGINTSEDFDAYVVTEASTLVPSSITSYSGNHYYSNFDTRSDMPSSQVDKASDVVSIVTGEYGAGRMQHGDFSWSFSESDDASHDVDTELQQAIINYSSTLVNLYTEPSASAEESGSSSSGGESSGEETESTEGSGSAIVPTSSSMVCYFTGKTPSNAEFYSFTSCSYSDSKGSAIVNGETYDACLKMESSTSVSFTTTQVATLTIVFGSTETPSLKINGDKLSSVDGVTIDGNMLTVKNLSVGTYTLTKDDGVNVYYIAVAYAESTDLQMIQSAEELKGVIYDLNGLEVRKKNLKANRIYICNGQKFILVK